jgi:hypothetical protein
VRCRDGCKTSPTISTSTSCPSSWVAS